MFGYFRELFGYKEVLEQKGAGKWRKVRRYRNPKKVAAFAAGCVLFVAVLVMTAWILVEEEMLPTPQLPESKPPVAEAPPPVVEVREISDDIDAFEPLLLDETDDVFSADVKNFASRATPQNGNAKRNEIWVQIKKRDGTIAVYEKMDEGDKELGEWQAFANESYVPTGTFSVRLIHNSENWTHDFGDGPVKGAYGLMFVKLGTAGGVSFGIHGTQPDTADRRVSVGVQMNNPDLEQLEKFLTPKMRVVIEE